MLKLKKQYQRSYKIKLFGQNELITIYPNVRSSVYKIFSTKQEKSTYFSNMIEYKHYKLKIRAKRGKNIKSLWSYTKLSNVYRNAKSWKHNSKRKKQYYN